MECKTCGLSHEFEGCEECGREKEQIYCMSCGACGISGCCDVGVCKRIRCLHGDEYIAEFKELESTVSEMMAMPFGPLLGQFMDLESRELALKKETDMLKEMLDITGWEFEYASEGSFYCTTSGGTKRRYFDSPKLSEYLKSEKEKNMTDLYYNMNGYPEPVHIYLGKSKIAVFHLFPERQAGHPLSKWDGTNRKNESFYDPEKPLFWSVEYDSKFKSENASEPYFLKHVEMPQAKLACSIFIKEWIKDNLQI